jgi:hypothetical protein
MSMLTEMNALKQENCWSTFFCNSSEKMASQLAASEWSDALKAYELIEGQVL